MKSPSVRAASLGLLVMLAGAPPAEAAFPTLYLKPVCLKQIHSPTTITYAPDGSGRLFICDQPGRIHIFQNGMLLPTPFLDISNTAAVVADRKVISVGTGYSERGLLCVAFHPGYANPASPGYRKFYVNYIKTYVAGVDPAPNGPGTQANAVSVIAEFQVSASDPNVAIPGSERQMLLYTQPQSNHNGGQLEFGPEVGPGGERYLYIGVGDGGSQMDNNLGHTGGNNTNPRPTDALGNAQDKTRLFGKILRIDPLGTNGPGGQYGIPAGNPFVGVGGGVREEIYSYGMRNPWKFSFDKRPGGTNRLFCGDVGGDRTEEVDIIVAGGNYGWRYKEGLEFPLFSSNAANDVPPGVNMTIPQADIDALKDPIAVYAHPGQTVGSPALPQLGLSVTGGFVYRGAAIPALQGKYVFGDYGTTGGASDGRMMGLEETSPGSGVFTLTQAIPLVGTNPIVGQRILCFGEDESGEIYVGLKTNSGVLLLDPPITGLPAGGIYKIVAAQSVTKTLQASKDNTIFSENPSYTGDPNYPSDALGYLYAGQTGPNWGPYFRRALVTFDLAAQVSAPAVIQSAQLKLRMTKVGPSAYGTSFTVHRLTETWGEGTSKNSAGTGTGAPPTVGDATWIDRFYNTSAWGTPGGSFTESPSATAPMAFPDQIWTSTPELKADVQAWIDTPASNAGWMIRGDETTEQSSCQFSSVQSGGIPPALTITYDAAPALEPYESWLNTYYPVGKFVDPMGDDDADTIPILDEFAFGTNPVVPSPGPLQYTGTFSGGGAIASTGQPITMFEPVVDGIDFRAMFVRRKDYVAAGLTYTPQFSANLTDWQDSTATPTVLADDGTHQIVSVPYPVFIAGEKPRFFHVVVTMTP